MMRHGTVGVSHTMVSDELNVFWSSRGSVQASFLAVCVRQMFLGCDIFMDSVTQNIRLVYFKFY